MGSEDALVFELHEEDESGTGIFVEDTDLVRTLREVVPGFSLARMAAAGEATRLPDGRFVLTAKGFDTFTRAAAKTGTPATAKSLDQKGHHYFFR